MNLDSLLSELEPLTHHARARRMVELGRRAASGDSDALACVGAMRSHESIYVRCLALQTVYGSRDAAVVLGCIGDVSRSVRRKAARLLRIACSNEQITAALHQIAERRLLTRMLGHLSRHGLSAPADAFIAQCLNDKNNPKAIDLLAYGSSALAEQYASELHEKAGSLAFVRLAKYHPAFTAEFLIREVQASPSLDPRQRYRYMSLFALLAKGAPDATLKLIRLLFERNEETNTLAAALRELVRKRPTEVFDLLKMRRESSRPQRPPGAFGVVRFDAVAHKLGAERLAYLIAHAASTLSDSKRGRRWFLRLSGDDRKSVIQAFLERTGGSYGAFLFRHIPSEGPDAKARERAYKRWSAAAQTNDGTIVLPALEDLPRDLREREAKRHLFELKNIANKPERRLPYARLLPFAEAKNVLLPWLGHPEGEERAKALRILIPSVALDRASIADALALVRSRKFEQDPVRLAMLESLAALPIACFSSAHLETVGAIAQDALDAADLSPSTAAAAERLIVRLFRIDGAWGAKWLEKLLETRGSVSTYGIGDGLTAEQTKKLSPYLNELATVWATRERAIALLTLSQSFGIRLKHADPLLGALERLASELPFVGVAVNSLALLRKHAPRRFAGLAVRLFEQDKSFCLIPCVASLISQYRQDLLPPLLDGKPMSGRFATGRTSWVIDFERGHGRWTQIQQNRYAIALNSLLADQKRDVPTLRFALSTLACLAYADPGPILSYASDTRPPVREIAIRALPWLDAGQGMTTLIECLGDDRIRYAIYALRKAFSEMTREAVLKQLRSVPTSKVTVAKEVVRLLGEMGGEDSFHDLIQLDRPGLHRDVRIALLRALWDHLNRPETWEIFHRAASDSDWILSSKLADIPVDRLSPDAEARLVRLLAQILARPEPDARLELLKRAAFLPLRDTSRAFFQRLLLHVQGTHPDESAHALSAVLIRMHPGEAGAVAQCLMELVPKRRHIKTLVPILMAQLGPYAPAHHLRIAEQLFKALNRDPLSVILAIELASKMLNTKDLVNYFIELSSRNLLHSDAMAAAQRAIEENTHPSLIEQELRAQNASQLRRLALCALVQSARPKDGWTSERRKRLEIYASDPSPDVAGAAVFIFPPE